MDCILIVNESVQDYHRNKNKKRGIFIKLGLEKAYDVNDWDFLDYVMGHKEFETKWRSWFHGCLVNSHFSILKKAHRKAFSPPHEVLDKGISYPFPFPISRRCF